MRLLIAGARGQLGVDCVSVLGSQSEVVGVDLPEFDITSEAQVNDTVSSLSPDVVLNCAAFTSVDNCETARDAAWKANALGPSYLANAAHSVGSLLVHVSTDYVFDGSRPHPTPYREDDEPHPLSWYGETKLAGERAVAKNAGEFIILRTAWLYGRHGRNFPKTILRLALNNPGKALRIVNDQHGSPTWSYRLAGQINKAIACGCRGIYHATSEGCCTWYEFARRFLELMGVEHELIPCSTAEYPTPARRPANSILENGRFKAAGINTMGAWDTDLAEFVAAFRDELLQEARSPKTT